MKTRKIISDLIDVNVLLALSLTYHPNHGRATQYWNHECSEKVILVRIVTLGLLRLLSNPRVVSSSALNGAQAWQQLTLLRLHPQVIFHPAEPNGLDVIFERWTSQAQVSGSGWTDAYLAAFAKASGYRLVTLDPGFSRFEGLDWLCLNE